MEEIVALHETIQSEAKDKATPPRQSQLSHGASSQPKAAKQQQTRVTEASNACKRKENHGGKVVGEPGQDCLEKKITEERLNVNISLPEFTCMDVLGKGSYGTVFMVRRHADKLIYAMKKICIEKLSTKRRKDALNEVRVLASLKHENIIRYHEAFIVRTSLYVVMELARGDLNQHIRAAKRRKQQFQGSTICSFFFQIVLGLNFLHSKKIIHRDIKPQNIFICDGDCLKIGDLGCSKVC